MSQHTRETIVDGRREDDVTSNDARVNQPHRVIVYHAPCPEIQIQDERSLKLGRILRRRLEEILLC